MLKLSFRDIISCILFSLSYTILSTSYHFTLFLFAAHPTLSPDVSLGLPRDHFLPPPFQTLFRFDLFLPSVYTTPLPSTLSPLLFCCLRLSHFVRILWSVFYLAIVLLSVFLMKSISVTTYFNKEKIWDNLTRARIWLMFLSFNTHSTLYKQATLYKLQKSDHVKLMAFPTTTHSVIFIPSNSWVNTIFWE